MSEEKKGRGRPNKNKNDITHNVNNNQNIPVNQSNEEANDIPETPIEQTNNITAENTDNDADLKDFQKDTGIKTPKNVSLESNASNEIENSVLAEIEDFESKQGLNDIPQEEYNPLKEAVKKRGYTDGKMGLENNTSNINKEEQHLQNNQGTLKEQEKVISEPAYLGGGQSKSPDIDATLINPSKSDENVLDVGDGNSYNNQQKQTKKPNTNTGNNNNGGGNNTNTNKTEKTEKKEEPVNNLKELSPKEKRDATERDADAILLAYKVHIPKVFNYFGQHDVAKLKDLDKKDLINLQQQLKRDGSTILDYIKQFNDDVDEAFRISDEEIEMIKPALVDVLMEQNIAFTPTQRLMFVVGQLLVAKIMLLIKFIRQKNVDIKEFKKMHLENMEVANRIREENDVIRRQNEEILRKMNEQAEKNNQANKEKDNSNLKVVKNETKKDEKVSDATVISETKNKDTNIEKKEPTLEDALNTNTTEEIEKEEKDNDNDIPN